VGAWDAGPFDNDDAADFVGEFDEAPRVAIIKASLEKIASAEPDAYIEAPECSEAVAAAALIALTSEVSTDVIRESSLAILKALHGTEKTQLAGIALKALARVGANSELKELWDESEDEAAREAWYSSIRTLQSTLAKL
jgi:hypothetical protein